MKTVSSAVSFGLDEQGRELNDQYLPARYITTRPCAPPPSTLDLAPSQHAATHTTMRNNLAHTAVRYTTRRL
ncbi:hypothetical protein E2C01_026147 [Portunus trituberculatus]|uniref:Uncharacterized protein n=1 Tax=Portunus trituberculatus TaxID=210409 RepID=A0A5B7EHL1_PORTR|nr:hypothetical protein [Portunus trituberculatus]